MIKESKPATILAEGSALLAALGIARVAQWLGKHPLIMSSSGQ
jgi:hypothetical protein